MADAYYVLPEITNEPVLSYAPGSKEKSEVKQVYKKMKSTTIDIPMFIGGEELKSAHKVPIHPPHDHQHLLGYYFKGDQTHVYKAIEAALAAKPAWEQMPWQERAAIFLKAADLIAGPYRAKLNAAAMLCQSKNVFQAEIDIVCELADFFRYNALFMTQIYEDQPESSPGIWNRMEYRPLEGFVFALTPFNFASIAGNLPGAPALMGNTVVWKPAGDQIYSAWVIMEVLREAGLPDGVINLIYVNGADAGEVIFSHPDFAGLHFTGSTVTFQHLWKTIAQNLPMYKSYPRIVGETGGKDFVLIHPSADAVAASVALTRGAFEYQGQKCSAASRAYIPKSLWPQVHDLMKAHLEEIKMGTPEDFTNFINAVINKKAYDKIVKYIEQAKQDEQVDILFGGRYDDSTGYFIEPTVIQTQNPYYRTLCEEIFGPVLTIFVYEDDKFDEIVEIVDQSTPYGLTGALFAQDRKVIESASKRLRYAAGNYYINDKPTGAVVGQQPFGGARQSGTNDKAGSLLNLLRWVSPRTIKENFNPPHDYRYPFMEEA